MIEQLARMPVEVDYGCEFRYRNPIVDSEDADRRASPSRAKRPTRWPRSAKPSRRARKTLAICNVVGQHGHARGRGTIYTHAGPEIGVASTKAFTSQLVALDLLALYLGQVRGTLTEDCANAAAGIDAHSAQDGNGSAGAMKTACTKSWRAQFFRHTNFLYLGRGIHYPIALEGALKLKEISYIHAEGYPAGEMKHGPNALIDENMPVVVLATRDRQRSGSHDALREERLEHQGSEGARRHRHLRGHRRRSPGARGFRSHHRGCRPPSELLAPLLEILPLQLLAYHIAVRRGCDVDQPRNLAKSVTVE